MVNKVDMDGSGMLNFPEFLMMMGLKMEAESAEDEIREAFQVFDGDGNGFINRQELACVMSNLGETLSAAEIQVWSLCHLSPVRNWWYNQSLPISSQQMGFKEMVQ